VDTPRSADDVASDLALALRGEMLGTHVAIGTRDGHRVRCEVIGGLTKNENRGGLATVVEVPIASKRRIDLWVAKGDPDREAVASGDEVDVEVGTPLFDEQFHVEGAPVDVVRALFDIEVCRLLAGLPKPELATVMVDGNPVLRVRIASWEERVVLIGADVLIRLVSRIEESYEVADAVHTHHGNPYRSDVTPRALIDAARDRDFTTLHTARRSRPWWRRFRRALRRLGGRDSEK
jgi:hypothetical protein